MLSGKSAIVTGSTSGIGLGIARGLAASGANIMLNGFGDAGEIETIRQEIANGHNIKVLYSGANMADEQEIAGMIAEAEEAFGGVDILVNNAGIQYVAPIEEFPVEKWNAILAINLSSAFHTTRLAIPGMKKKSWGRIVNIASAHALVASPFKSAYVAAKHGIAGLTKTAALEVAEHGITVNAVCPGYVMTPLVEKQIPEQAKARGITEAQVISDVLLAAQPTKHFVTVEELSALVNFLCTDNARSITGTTLPVDGGWTAHEQGGFPMRKADVLKLPSMPMAGPSYPAGPYRFVNREFLVISYETDPDLIRAGLPEPLEPMDQPVVHYEWIKMPDSSGFGSYTESGLVIPARLNGEEVNFVSQMYLDDDPPIAAGREIWGFPKKYAHPKLEVVKDTLTGTLEYAGQLVAMGTMGYKHEAMAGNGEITRATLSKTQINLKLIPGVDGRAEVCQLVAINLTDIVVKGSWIGPGRLHLVPHVNAPVADFPVRRIVGAHHFLADLTLPYGRVVYDYNKQGEELAEAAE